MFEIHTSHKLNSIIRLPFKSLWYKAIFDTSRISPDDEVYFLIYEDCKLADQRDYLEHLRKKYKHCKMIFCFRNPLQKQYLFMAHRYQRVRDCYDLCLTMNRADAVTWGITFCDYWPCLLPDKDFEPENASDVFFVGQAKDRLPKILEIYERLTDAGLKCKFHIVGVPRKDQKYPESIHYNERLSYDDVLQCVKNTKCVLEILPFGQNYSSLRVCEALWYRKKLLTTNLEAPQEWFYHPEIVQCFADAKDIDTKFINRPLSIDDERRIFGQMKIGDFGRFADWVIEHIN